MSSTDNTPGEKSAADKAGNKPLESDDRFDTEDHYEDADRDTDYPTAYGEDDLDSESWDDDELDADSGEEQLEDLEFVLDELPPSTGDPEELEADSFEAEEFENDAGEEQEWLEQETFEEETEGPRWPIGLIVVAVIALLLLAAGGYGVVQQRTEMQEQIRQLRADLATAVSPEDLSASRVSLREAKQQVFELRNSIENLTRDNRRLSDTVAGLEAQLEVGPVTAAPTTAAEPAAPVAKPAAPVKTPGAVAVAVAKPAATLPVTTDSTATTGSGWFVNFGSYQKRETAESWTGRLKPASGKVVVTTGTKSGSTYYRVRVVELADRAEADAIARALEKDYGLSRLWVGKQ